jgi:hypothetical protein
MSYDSDDNYVSEDEVADAKARASLAQLNAYRKRRQDQMGWLGSSMTILMAFSLIMAVASIWFLALAVVAIFVWLYSFRTWKANKPFE